MSNSIEPFIHRKVVVLKQGEPCRIAALAMAERGVGCVVVSNGKNRIVGLITDRDIVRKVVAEDRDPETPLGDLITNSLKRVGQDASIIEVLGLMERYGIRRVPVVRSYGKKEHCEGLISLDDLIVAKRVSPDQLSRILRSQVRSRGPGRLDRRQARRRQSYGSLLTKLRQSTGLETGRAEAFLLHTLASLVTRLSPVGASQFISQLPGMLQDDLATFSHGPDRKISVKRLVSELETEFDLTKTKVEKNLRAFWRTLFEVTGSGELNDVLAQLPGEFSRLFLGEAPKLGARAQENFYEDVSRPNH